MNLNVIGLSFDKLILTEYRKEWTEVFREEKIIISKVLSQYNYDIKHIGSTAILGMIAKPIIDIMVGIDEDDKLVGVAKLLEAIGYENFGECGRPGRIFMVKGKPENCTHHLHLMKKGSKYWSDNLIFQEILKNNKCVAKDYMNLKLELLEQFPDNRNMYRILKSEFIEDIICDITRMNASD